MNRTTTLLCALALLTTAPAAFAADDDVELTPELRAEIAFREIQLGLTRPRSTSHEDADLIVCQRRAITGSRLQNIVCASNRVWVDIRDGDAEPSAASDDFMVMPLGTFRRLERQYGPLPRDYTGIHGRRR